MDKINPLRELIRVVLKQLGYLEKEGATCCGVTIGQCQAIEEIGLAKELTLNELAEMLNLDKSTTSRTVNNLVIDGLVERLVDSSDRRFVKIALTEKGVGIFNSINEVLEIYFQRILGDIPKEKQEQVIDSLLLLAEAVRKNKCC